MQRTLVLLKPDCVQRRLVGALIGRFEQKGLRLVALKFVQASRDLAEKHYAVHKGKPFYESLLSFLTSGPTVALVWEGREAIAVVRTMVGSTDGAQAPPGTIVSASTTDGVAVACGDGCALELVDLQLEGKRVVPARDLLATGALRVGARFEHA